MSNDRGLAKGWQEVTVRAARPASAKSDCSCELEAVGREEQHVFATTVDLLAAVGTSLYSYRHPATPGDVVGTR